MKGPYPFRLRDDWPEAYTGFDGGSELPLLLTEDLAQEYFEAAARYIYWIKTEGSVPFSKVDSQGVNNADLFTRFNNLTHGTLTSLNDAFVRYLKEPGILVKRDFREASISLKYPEAPESLLNACKLIKEREDFSFRGFLAHWLKSVKPQYTQACLLHLEDSVIFAKDHSFNVSSSAEELLQNLKATGLSRAISKIRDIAPVETESQVLARTKYKQAFEDLYKDKGYAQISNLDIRSFEPQY